MFQTGVNPPVYTASRVTEVSTIDAAINIEKIIGTKYLTTAGLVNRITIIRSFL